MIGKLLLSKPLTQMDPAQRGAIVFNRALSYNQLYDAHLLDHGDRGYKDYDGWCEHHRCDEQDVYLA